MKVLSPITSSHTSMLSVSYFISSQHRFHILMAAYTLNVLSCHKRNPTFLYLQLIIKKISFYTLFSDPIFARCTCLSQPILRDSLCALLSTSTLFVSIVTLRNTGGYQGIQIIVPNTKYTCIKPQIRFLEQFPAHSFLLFLYTLNFELQVQNHHCAKNIFQDNLITFILTCNSRYFYPILPLV